MSLLTKDKITEIFCIANDFSKEFNSEIEKTVCKPLMVEKSVIVGVSDGEFIEIAEGVLPHESIITDSIGR